jgi:PAS domain S-box-containing protein
VIDSKNPVNTENNSHLQKNISERIPWILIIIFILLSIVVSYFGTLYYRTQRDRIKNEKQGELSAIANLKVNEIISWRDEHIRDADLITNNPLLKEGITALINEKSEKSKQNIDKWLEAMLTLYDFDSIVLLDKNENIIYQIPDNESSKDRTFHKYSNNYEISNKKSVLTDIYIDSLNGKAGLDLIVPLTDINGKDTTLYGSMILKINPAKYLFPLIQSCPSLSISSETILLRKENNYAVYLNEIKNESNNGFVLKEKLEDVNSITYKAVKGTFGIYEGIDYRGTEVLSYIKPVPIFNWFLVVKVDKDEIYTGIKERAQIVTVSIFILIFLQGLLLTLFWRHQRFKYYKTQYLYQLQREALTKHFNFMIKYANDAIILCDMNGNIIEVNEKAISMYGYTESEFLSMHLSKLKTPETRYLYDTIINEISKEGAKVIEAVHIRKDGTVFCMENSVRIIDIEGVKYFQSIIRDITERKETEKKIIESESELRALLSSMNDVILIVDCEGIVVKVASSNVDLLYKPSEEIVGKTLQECIPTKQAEIFRGYVDIVLKTKKFISVEYCLSIENKIKWFDATLSPMENNKVILVARDVTERKIKERKIEQLTRIYKVLSNVNQAVVRFRDINDLFMEVCKVIVDDGKFKMAWVGIVNDSNGELEVKARYGDRTEYIDNLNFNNINIEDNVVEPVVITLLSGQNSICNNIDMEYKIPNPPWREIALKNGFNSVASFGIRLIGKPSGVLVVYSSEVGNFKENEIQLFDELASDLNYALEFFEKEELIRKFSSGIQYSFVSIAITDLNGIIEFVNPKFTESCGYSVEELIGKDIKMLRPPNIWEEEEIQLWNILQDKGEWSGELPILKKNGEMYWEFAVMSPIKNEKGKTTHLLSVKEDITKRKQTEAELKNAKDKAEEANRLKSNFLANMSHELRTPMTGILGFAELMFNELKEPELKEMSGMILKGGLRLTDTLNSILDLSNIEANKIEIKRQDKNIVELIRDSVKLFELSAKQKGIVVKFLPDNDTPKANIDERLFIQVMNNLINNAIKFTEEGEIKVLCSKQETENGDFISIKVKDTGIGILPKDIEKIFEPFRQVSEGLNRKYEGTGLGLTISKKFVEIMGGQLTVDSEISKGSVFTVLLPICIDEQFKQKTVWTNKDINIFKNFKIPPNILHVEDDLLGRKVVKVLLKNECFVTDVEDGETAILMAKKQKYDLVLMDINLRGISGLETVQVLRTIPGYDKTPIVAVTAYAMVGDKEEFIRNGCTHYLSKPFIKESLIKIIREALNL